MEHQPNQPTPNLNLGAAPTQNINPNPQGEINNEQNLLLDPKINLMDQLDNSQNPQMNEMEHNKPMELPPPQMDHQYRKPNNTLLEKR
jgi:hypothetical protein